MKPFERKILKWVREFPLIVNERRVLLAVSGGPDSVSMFHAFRRLREDLKVEIGVAHFNHKLRKDADEDAQFVKDMCGEVRFYYGEMSGSRRKGFSPEEWARLKRYEFLEEVAEREGYELIATAHTLDDQVETILMRIFRGTGVEGLSGIMPKMGKIIRPLLCVWRKDVMDYLKRMDAPFRTDPTNLDRKIPRNLIRLEVIPYMEKHFPSFKEGLINLWKSAAGLRGILKKLEGAFLTERNGDFVLEMKGLEEADVLTIRWVLKRAVEKILGELPPSSRIVDSLLPLLARGFREVHLRKGWRAEKEGAKIIFTRKKKEDEEWEVVIDSEGVHRVGNFTVEIKSLSPPFSIPSDPFKALLDAEEVQFPIVVRNCRKGDRFIPLGMKKEKKLQDFFTDLKVPFRKRKEIPIFLSKGKIIWVGGLRIDERAKVKADTKRAMFLSIC